MTKLCVFSDSHGLALYMLRAIRAEDPDLVVHLGDGYSDLSEVMEAFPGLPLRCVRGNCDVFSPAPAKLAFSVEGKRILAVHGHAYQVKTDRSLQRLCYAALEEEADLVLFGHTHVPCHDRWGDLEILNPGSISGLRPSYGVVAVENGRLSAELKKL